MSEENSRARKTRPYGAFFMFGCLEGSKVGGGAGVRQ